MSAGASSAALVKHLEVQGYCLAELALQHTTPSSSGLQSNQETASAEHSGRVGGVMGIPGQPVEASADSQSWGGVTGPLISTPYKHTMSWNPSIHCR